MKLVTIQTMSAYNELKNNGYLITTVMFGQLTTLFENIMGFIKSLKNTKLN